jgi:hypothetical protein
MGYSQAELEAVQALWNLRFPPDLVEMLKKHRPLLDGAASFDWLQTATIQERLDWPFDSFCYDVEHNNVWWPEWGEKPSSSTEQRDRLKEIFAKVPRLIPLYRHRYIPQEPHESGNPIFSVYQTDVICYGVNLQDWMEREQRGWDTKPWQRIKEIPFWSEALRKNNSEP